LEFSAVETSLSTLATIILAGILKLTRVDSESSEPAWWGRILWLKRKVKESMSGLSAHSAAIEIIAQA